MEGIVVSNPQFAMFICGDDGASLITVDGPTLEEAKDQVKRAHPKMEIVEIYQRIE